MRRTLRHLVLLLAPAFAAAGDAAAQPQAPLVVVLVHGSESLGRARSDLLRLNPAVAVGVTGLAAQAFWTEPRSVPIVVAAGVATLEIIATLVRPGGNVTGVLNQSAEFTPKLFELLRDIAPRAERVVALSSGRGLIVVEVRDLSRTAAKALGMTLIEAIANSPEEIDQLAARCERERCEAVVTLPDPTLPGRLAESLAALLARLRLPDVSFSVASAGSTA